MLFRTAWVYSAVGKNFLKTILRLARERDELRIVSDQIGSPTHAATIAAGTAFALQRWLTAAPDQRSSLQGTFHLVSSGSCSWHDFASLIVEEARARLGAQAGSQAQDPATQGIRCTKVTPISTADYPTPAKRPGYSVLDGSKFCSTFGLTLPHWTSLVGRTVELLMGASGG
jgi:dTDP-4-dehydrorhamnose reductase